MPARSQRVGDLGCSSSGIARQLAGARGSALLCMTSRSSSRPASSSASQGSMSRTTTIACQPSRVLRAALRRPRRHPARPRRVAVPRRRRGVHAARRAGARGVRAGRRRGRAVLGPPAVDAAPRRVLLGLRSYIFEAGCGMVLDGELRLLTEEIDDAARDRAAARARFAARDVRPVEPGARVLAAVPGVRTSMWRRPTHCSSRRARGLRLVDNGVMHGAAAGGRAYHLVPRAASKARGGGAAHAGARDAPEEVIAVASAPPFSYVLLGEIRRDHPRQLLAAREPGWRGGCDGATRSGILSADSNAEMTISCASALTVWTATCQPRALAFVIVVVSSSGFHQTCEPQPLSRVTFSPRTRSQSASRGPGRCSMYQSPRCSPVEYGAVEREVAVDPEREPGAGGERIQVLKPRRICTPTLPRWTSSRAPSRPPSPLRASRSPSRTCRRSSGRARR